MVLLILRGIFKFTVQHNQLATLALSENRYKTCHWGDTFSKVHVYFLGTNMYTLGMCL